MKKLTIISMAALLLLAASCKKEKKTEAGGDAVFRATTETHSGDSKTQLVVDQDGQKAVIWNSGDAIKVFDANTPRNAYEFTAVSGGKSTTSFSGNAPESFFESSSYTAFYPSDNVSHDGSNYKITLPDTQTYAENSFGPGANPMAAKSETTELSFKNICGLLKLQLYTVPDARSVKSITLKSNKSDEMLWGTGTVDVSNFNDASKPSLGTLTVPDDKDGSTLTLDCSSSEPLSIDKTDPSVFYFVVPSGTLAGGFTVTVTDTDDKPILIKAARANTDNMIQRSKITAMPALLVAPIGALPGLFSIDAGPDGKPETFDDNSKIFFSQGNLQYCAKDNLGSATEGNNVGGTWRFALHQYELLHEGDDDDVSDEYNANYNGWIDFFGWGTSGYNYNNKNYQPWSTSNTDEEYGPGSNHLTVSGLSDWGANNITNGGTGWRTLSGKRADKNGWCFLFEDRKYNDKLLYGFGKINDKKGVIILPDDYWNNPVDASFKVGQSNWGNVYNSNSASGISWDDMEAVGVVFLPAAGYRFYKNSVSTPIRIENVNLNGRYWSSGNYGENMAYYVGFSYSSSSSACSMTFDNTNRSTRGFSVRLVKDAN